MKGGHTLSEKLVSHITCSIQNFCVNGLVQEEAAQHSDGRSTDCHITPPESMHERLLVAASSQARSPAPGSADEVCTVILHQPNCSVTSSLCLGFIHGFMHAQQKPNQSAPTIHHQHIDGL